MGGAIPALYYMIIKRFNLYVVAGANDFTVIEDMGVCNWYIYNGQYQEGYTTQSFTDLETADLSLLEQYIAEDPDTWGCVLTGGTWRGVGEAPEKIQNRFPATLIKDFSAYTTQSSYRLLCTDNDSGFYAVSTNMPLNTRGSWNEDRRVQGWNLYDDEDTLMVSEFTGNGVLRTVDAMVLMQAVLDEDGNIVSTDGAMAVINVGETGAGNAQYAGFNWTSAMISWFNGVTSTHPVDPGGDPFAPGGTTGDDESESEGGEGSFENEEVTVDPPALPSISALTSGFIAVYMPTFSQLQALGDYLWSDLFSLDTFKKLFSDPMQAILGLSIVPVAPPTQQGYVVIGNVNTGLTMPRVTNQFVTVDCGSITLPEYWGGYLDYSPYTKVEIYLPYIGVRPLDTDEVMGKTLSVVYHVDVLSGSCACFIQCDNTIRYHYVGQCGASIPITANDWTRVVNGAVSIATALGVGVATLGAGAAAGGITAASMAGTGALVGGIASQVLASKPRVEHSGSLAGMGGLLGVQFPYVMIQRPRQAVPTGQNAFTGYPSFIKRTLSTVTGYTQVTGVHLTGLSCTDEEKKEIQAYLEAGVIL